MSPRSRRSSMTAGQTRRKTVTPSPLSQSTSAIHLQPPDIGPHVTRKLSKRRKPLIGSLFKSQDKDSGEHGIQAAPAPQLHVASAPPLHVESAPVTPVDAPASNQSSTVPNGLHPGGDLPKRHSTVPPIMPSSLSYGSAKMHHLGEKREKRGSVLGRLAKKLSIMRRPQELVRGSIGSTDEWQHIGMGDAHSDRNVRRSAVIQRQSLERPSMEQRKTDPIKRIPVPTLTTESSVGSAPDTAPPRQSEDHKSIMSLEPPLAMGKLTIANPDAPSSVDNTPVKPDIPLPADPEPVPEVVQRPRASHDLLERPKSTLPPLPDPTLNQDHSSQGSATPVMPVAAAATELPPLTPPRRPSPAEIPHSPATTDPMTLYPTYMNGLSSPSAVPFPLADQRPSSAISTSARATMGSSPVSFMDDSPLSRASMIVNPPTPHTDPMPMMPTLAIPTSVSAPAIQTVLERPSYIPSPSKVDASKPRVPAIPTSVSAPTAQTALERLSRNPSPSKIDSSKTRVEATRSKAEVEVKDEQQRGTTPVTSRRTETFKLIRTASGNVLPANETITAGGEHWEVVGSSDNSKKNKAKERSSRSKDRDTESRKGHRRHGHSAPQETEADKHRARQRSFHSKGGDQTQTVPTPAESTRAHSMDIPRPNQEVSKHNRKESKLNLDKPQPPPPAATPEPSRVERRPSSSNRPTSELPSTAELNALRAREAWDMDRLWKGKSMYYGEPEHNGSIPSPSQTREPKGLMPSVNTDLSRDNGTARSSGHGSSHTSFMVQPFQGQAPANMFYSNMPSAPPPTIYSPPTLQPTPYPSSASYDYSQSYRSLPHSLSLPPQEPLPETSTRSNPLPPPPRESSYQPSLLPPLSDRSGRPSDHWTKHPSITTAH